MDSELAASVGEGHYSTLAQRFRLALHYHYYHLGRLKRARPLLRRARGHPS